MENRRIWQVAAGDKDRNYSDLCLRMGVILNGPGYAGPWPKCVDTLKKDGRSSKKISDIRRFAEEIQDGDIVVLREGTNKVLGVGLVVGDYQWDDIFGDVDGWNLQHVRRVGWLRLGDEVPRIFPTYTLKQGDTTQELTSEVVKEWVDSLSIDTSKRIPINPLPQSEGNNVDFEEVSNFLFDEGVASNSIDTLSKEIDELVRIARWYKNFENPSEFETVAYLAVPLLRALGWTPQKMAIEWNNVDIALFSQLPRSPNNLSVVVEAKKKGNSCLTAVSQAEAYAKGKKSCERLIVTDGLRYGVYLKKVDEFVLHAYFNITRMRDSYAIHKCAGVKEALRAMTPEWQGIA